MLNFFCKWLCGCDCPTGSITLNYGSHEVDIKTDCEPKEVYVNVWGCPMACVGNIDYVSAKINPTGFTLYGNISSPHCVVKYIVKC